MKRILSIDGGGIRGIIPGLLLVNLEDKLKIATNDPNAHISDFFDFFAGTSTGGILTALLLCPSEDNPNRPRFTTREALNIYLDHGPQIFSTTRWRRFLSKFGVLSELYDEKIFECVLMDYFGDIRLSQLIKPCIITAYNIELRKNHFFRQQKAISHGESRDFYIRDVCRATAAAPTYFSVAEIFSLANIRYPLLDGGVFAQNPSISALLEVLKNFNTFKITDISILSLGTGAARNAYNYEDFKKKWAISIGPALVDIMTSSSSESTDYFLRQLFRSVQRTQNYIRIEPNNLLSVESSLDAATKSNIQKLESLADRMISENEALIDDIVVDLIADRKSRNRKSAWNFLKNKD
ncbi:patatin-like phospholipase family protein [Sphingobacterium spiritivorum]|uniref:Phospholipase, patatin family n=1 Tax=Sphingobacterium spiritivorum ATCC 33861 TaxID=525373 RepID=D7VQE1_SPHSI|nr:patatin-like phospholipase family protein [Sphingobacterium spiritivorum]EFK55992.1 phospholipase, patatin family [Sphingobacterium spiritivorum ATCC 33861]QQT35875.1 patatin-like phospholipase family protein [Sphingobacterium spiritivorum]WQD32602.1 patatin-like phospholipase family protein [Sphingobacterium spiritivorum]SUJ11429.1 Patatin [Sphingobacterium spiritivorum]